MRLRQRETVNFSGSICPLETESFHPTNSERKALTVWAERMPCYCSLPPPKPKGRLQVAWTGQQQEGDQMRAHQCIGHSTEQRKN